MLVGMNLNFVYIYFPDYQFNLKPTQIFERGIVLLVMECQRGLVWNSVMESQLSLPGILKKLYNIQMFG